MKISKYANAFARYFICTFSHLLICTLTHDRYFNSPAFELRYEMF